MFLEFVVGFEYEYRRAHTMSDPYPTAKRIPTGHTEGREHR